MSDIKPALTAEEWQRKELRWASNGLQFWVKAATREIGQYQTDDWELYIGASASGNSTTQCHKQQHGVAALALYGQPFGFTREDVELLDLALSELWNDYPDWYEEADNNKRLQSLIARIEAILPPLSHKRQGDSEADTGCVRNPRQAPDFPSRQVDGAHRPSCYRPTVQPT